MEAAEDPIQASSLLHNATTSAIPNKDTFLKYNLEAILRRNTASLDLTSLNHQGRARQALILGISHITGSEKCQSLADIEIAIQKCSESLTFTPDTHPDRAYRLSTLGSAYGFKYKLTNELDDLELTIFLDHKALLATHINHRDRMSRLQILAGAYRARWRHNKSLDDLSTAIYYYQESLDLTPEDHPEKAAKLETLGICWRVKYKESGVLTDLDNAIEVSEKAIHLTSVGNPARPSRLQELGSNYRIRYRRTGALNDLETAIALLKEALDQTAEKHWQRAGLLNNLGIAYRARYRRLGVVSDLQAAIQNCKASLDLTPQDHTCRPWRLQGLGNGYADRYMELHQSVDLDAAFQIFQDALKLVPHDDYMRADLIGSLGAVCEYKYRDTGESTDSSRGIELYQEAVDATSLDDIDRGRRLQELGLSHRDRYRKTGESLHQDRAMKYLQEALEHQPSPPFYRLRSGRVLLEMYADKEKWQLAYSTACLALPLIPLLTPHSLGLLDKQHFVNETFGIASNAAAIALKMDKMPYDAVEMLELGRGIVTGYFNDMRVEISSLSKTYPYIAEQFSKIRSILDKPRDSREDGKRYELGTRLERIIQEIRTLPDFSRFLLSPEEITLRSIAANGPIIIINVSKYGCHALTIEKRRTFAVALPLLKGAEILARTGSLITLDTELLEWLWIAIARPILDALGFAEDPKTVWPRVYWIPTGPLEKFPIHAAGQYSTHKIGNTVMDRVISSYSSSVSALVRTYQNLSNADLATERSRMVLIGMSQTPNHKPLEFVSKEIEAVIEVGGSMDIEIQQPLAHRKEILSALNDCRMLHFAGHGYIDQANPMQSALILDDGRVTVEDLFERNLRNRQPFLAYLSACGTSQIKHDGLMDEGLHLVGACQLAGFEHVIGTLWEVNDESCADVARLTYEWMNNKGQSHKSVGEGLHYACRELRRQWMESTDSMMISRSEAKAGGVTSSSQRSLLQQDSRSTRDAEMIPDLPLNWVPYVHFGV